MIKKQNALPLLLMMLLPLALYAQQYSVVYDDLDLPSKILHMAKKYSIYLPAGYETSHRSYPVLYLLHGGGDNHISWLQDAELQHYADLAIASGKTTPMIIVMPNANDVQRGYTNDLSGEWRYEDFFFQEFIPHVEKTWRIKSDKHYRAICGNSMGGNGTWVYALHHPEMFSSACPLSAGTGPTSVANLKDRLARNSQNKDKSYTDEQLQSYVDRYNVLHMVETMPLAALQSVRWYIDCGDNDFLYKGNALVRIAMREREIAHEYRVRDGEHSWYYWQDSLPGVLEYVSYGFRND